MYTYTRPDTLHTAGTTSSTTLSSCNLQKMFHAFESTNPDCEMCIELFNNLNINYQGGAGFLEVAEGAGAGAGAGAWAGTGAGAGAGGGAGAGVGLGLDLCKDIPEGLYEQCEGIANPGPGRGSSPGADYPGFSGRRDVYKLLRGGCVDLSTITPVEQIPGKCPGIIACNVRPTRCIYHTVYIYIYSCIREPTYEHKHTPLQHRCSRCSMSNST